MDCKDRIVALRTDHDETQAQLAQALGVHRVQWTKYEIGVNELPLRYLVKLCEHYHVSADYLLGLPQGLEWPR